MSQPSGGDRPGVLVDHLMLHDLVNHLTIALGHSDLLLLDAVNDLPHRSSLEEIRRACRKAVELVDGWRARLPSAP